MYLSNRLTFYLVFSVLLLAFVAVPVMAHAPGSAERTHTHPVKVIIPAQDMNGDDDTDDPGEGEVAVHGAHPTATITLKPDQANVRGNMVAVIADDTDTSDVTENQFTLLVTFDVDVVDAGTQATINDANDNIANGDLTDANFLFSVLDGNNGTITAPTFQIVRVNDGAATPAITDAGRKQFEITVDSTVFPSGTADAADEEFTFRIRLNLDSIFGLQKQEILPDGIQTVAVPGGGNLQSNTLTLTLVKELEMLSEPTVTVSAPILNPSGSLSFVIVTVPDVTGLAEAVEVTPNTATVVVTDSGSPYTATVTPPDAYTDITLTVPMNSVGHVKDSRIMGPEAAATETYNAPDRPAAPDTTAPGFTIATAPENNAEVMAGGTVQFTITATEALGTGNNELQESDVQGTTNVASKTFLRASNTVYVVVVTPTDRSMPITITIPANAVMDTAGNGNAVKTHTFTPTDTIAPTLTYTAVPATGTDVGKILYTITFSEAVTDFTEDDIIRGSGVALAGNLTPNADMTVFTVLVNPAPAGSLTSITIRAGAVTDGTNKLVGDQVLPYTPPAAATPARITNTNLGTQTAGATLTITFDKDPGRVVIVSPATLLAGSGTIRTTTAATTAGSHSIALAWTGIDATSDSDNGSGTVTYTIPAPPASANPTSPSNIMMVNIPANSFVVLVRANNTSVAEGLNFPNVPPVGGKAVDVRVWADMPDLQDLFHRSAQSPGGALVLRMSADDAAADRPATGTVGMSEIMWGRDLGKTTATEQAAGQWIELQNLNDKAVNVLIYAQKGSDGLISNGQLGNTAAGDSLLGNPAGMVVDSIQNIRDDGVQTRGGWDVKGKEGNSLTAQPFASMHRILPHAKSKYANADGSRFNNAKGVWNGHWAESGDVYLRGKTVATPPVLFDYRGTPGAVNNVPRISVLSRQGRSFKPASNTIVINEVGNRSNDNYDWIELRNASGGNINLKNYLITMVRDSNTEHVLVRFPAADNAQVAAGGVFLLLRTDPANDTNHPIAATGYNVDLAVERQEPGTSNSPVRYKVFSSLVLPNDDGQKFVLMVRRPDSGHNNGPGAHKDQGTSETASQQNGGADLDKIVDIAGYDDNLGKSAYPNALSSTSFWPLYDFAAPRSDKNTFRLDSVLQRNRTTTKHDLGGTGIEGDDGNKPAFGGRGWTGVGYRRTATPSNMNGGTPGYPNGALHGAGGTIVGSVYISEIMYADAGNAALPQWIELRNPSNTVGADLHNWRLTIRNHDKNADGSIWGRTQSSVLLRGLKIKPNGTVLITTRTGPRSDVHLANSDIFSFWPLRKNDFGMANANSNVINTYGFRISLHANAHGSDSSKWQLADDVGNLATPNANDRRGNNDIFDMPRWMWPDANAEDGSRISVVRKVKNKDTLEPTNGMKMWSWVLSSMDSRTAMIDHVYYGHRDDTSTPGQTYGQPLPVTLSHFRPTLEDGKVVIRWTTESELDNAGFNLYRSETRNGEFTKVNEQMIQGNGTTAERSTYKWVDSSAKLGAVYYYQIEDVSFAGERQKLTTTKLKGLISAKGKLTTQWGELKEVQ